MEDNPVHHYAEVGSAKQQEAEYAVLGPGGRPGPRTAVTSDYAEVRLFYFRETMLVSAVQLLPVCKSNHQFHNL